VPVYQYQAYSREGQKAKGTVEADSLKDAREELRQQGLVVTHLQAKRAWFGKGNLTGDNLIAFTVQLSQLVGAGVPLYEGLMAIEQQYRQETFHPVLIGLAERIKGGASLSDAMEIYPGSFDRLFASMIRAGEAVGGLDMALEKIADLLAREQKIKKGLMTALLYPMVLAIFSTLIVALLLGFVVPSLSSVLEGRQVNRLTAFVMALSKLFQQWWPALVVGSIALTLWLMIQLKKPKTLASIQRLLMKMPLIKGVLLQAALTRFARTVATLLSGGLNMIDSLRIGRHVMKNVVLEEIIERAEKRIIQGSSLSKELMKSPLLPPLFCRMLSIGEESGEMVKLLGKVADMYDQELDKNISRLMALAQPVILIIMGALIGLILMAVLLPMTDTSAFSLNS
jgi:general secretion pathway protein F/type IV pilus assembly protein PilC